MDVKHLFVKIQTERDEREDAIGITGTFKQGIINTRQFLIYCLLAFHELLRLEIFKYIYQKYKRNLFALKYNINTKNDS